jgi:hypothetical protein
MQFDIGQTIISTKQTNDFIITRYEWQQSSIMPSKMITKWTWQISKKRKKRSNKSNDKSNHTKLMTYL